LDKRRVNCGSRAKNGTPWVSFSVAVDEASEEATTWIRVVMFGEWATELYSELKRSTEVYCEGRLRLESWVGRDGRERSGLSVAVAKLVGLGELGLTPTHGGRNLSSPHWNNPSSRDTAVPRRRTYPSDDSRLRELCHFGLFLADSP
jgi:single-stranded DNA-binding protein